MSRNLNKSNYIIVGLIILVILNWSAFYLVQESIGIADALEHVEKPDAIQQLQQKQMFGNIFSAAVFTLDIIAILLFMYLLFKFILKRFQKSIPHK